MTSGNVFKTALASGRPQIGLWLSMADPYLAEVSATAGFDWLLIDGEHGPNDLRSTLAALQAVAPYRAQPVVRAVAGEVPLIKQLLDIGAQNLLVPMVDTPEQARAIVSATRYPPTGLRGVGSAVARASRWSARADYLERADDEVCLLVQAETVTALCHLEAICAVDGIDGVFIGPADLAASMGYCGRPDHPAVQAAIERAIQTIVASGKAAGTLTSDPVQARHYLELGCTFVATGVDVLIYANAVRRLASDFSAASSGQAAGFILNSPDIPANGTIAQSFEFDGFGCSGDNRSPALKWSGAPQGTQAFAVTVYDPDAPTGSGWWHWMVINIPADVNELAANAGAVGGAKLPKGASHARIDYGVAGWGGVCPPAGDAPHRYIFTVHALKEKLEVPPDATAALTGFMINGNSLGTASFTAKYGRPKAE